MSRTGSTVHTNTIDSFYSIFKRGTKGVYQRCSKKHLHRYAAEFDFRYSSRVATWLRRSEPRRCALQGVGDKRLTYRRTSERTAA